MSQGNTIYNANDQKLSQILGAPMVPEPSVPTYAATIALDATVNSYFDVVTTSAVGNATLTISGGQPGQPINIMVTNDATANRTITFGTGFTATGTLVGNTSKTYTVGFVYSGARSSFVEIARTAAGGA